MMISEKMNAKLNEQVTNEFFAAHSYLGMAATFEGMGLKIFAKRFFQQTDEERGHAMKILKYVLEVGGKVVLQAIPEPKGDYASAEQIVQTALEHELRVTDQINKLVALAEQEKDYATRSFLQWYVDEQVEEVSSMTELLALVKMAGPKQLLNLESRLQQMMGE